MEVSLDDLEEHLRVLVPLISQGLTNPEIALRLGLRVRSVETYVSEIMTQTGHRPRAHLIVAAQRWLESKTLESRED
ncbi:MAG: hypothetical protein HYX53_07780 [Chloroflexi bacterium]|nr:hypothetical protein [Chloroflexota bacterium]